MSEIITRCPHCGLTHDAPTGLFGSVDICNVDATLCFRCGHWSIYDESLTDKLRKPTQREAKEIDNDDRCVVVNNAWLATRLNQPGRPQ